MCCFPAPEEVPSAQKCFTKEDWVLLDAMGANPSPASSGKFLTMHKRRRKKLTTRSLLQDHAILDDIHHGIVQVNGFFYKEKFHKYITVFNFHFRIY